MTTFDDPVADWRHRLTFLPAALTIVIVGGLVGRGLYASKSISNQYRLAARQAIADENLDQAKFYYSRLVGAGDQGTSQDQLNWVAILDASGERQQARDLLDQLAPDDDVGYADAHRQKAEWYTDQIRRTGPDKGSMEKLHWHLRHGARDPSVESDLLWANYHLLVEQIDAAVDRYTSAASRKPELWFEIAKLYRQMKWDDPGKRAIARAEAHARDAVAANPLDTTARLRLADILADRGEMEAVETLIDDGLRVAGKAPAIRLAASKFALMKIDQIRPDDPSADNQRLELLARACKLAPNNPDVYRVLMSLYSGSDSPAQKLAYRKTLEAAIVAGESVPQAHFSLGNLLFVEGDTAAASFHLERAFEGDPNLAIVANNLAWVLSQADPPQLDRAESLARRALAAEPDNATFGDTLGTILFNASKYDEALSHLERVLPMAQGIKKSKIHNMLSAIYEELNRPNLAAMHRQRVEE